MKRRNFLSLAGAGMAGTSLFPGFTLASNWSQGKIRWIKSPGSRLFGQVNCDDQPFVRMESSSVVDASITLVSESNAILNLRPGQEAVETDQLKSSLRHELHTSGAGTGENILEAVLVIRNTGKRNQNVDARFATSAHSSSKFQEQKLYIPISAAGLFKDSRHAPMGSLDFLTDCDNRIGTDPFTCHYLEPMAGNPSVKKTKALLLAPVIDSYYPGTDWRVALFTDSSQACEFKCSINEQMIPIWSAQKRIILKPGEEKVVRCFLQVHKGDSMVAWKGFHKFGHHELLAVPDWLREIRVHYYDFLSSANGEKGHRGDGYESDLKYFRDYHVGMATQHGYYHAIGDFIQPERQTWLAMMGSKAGPVEMSIQKMKDRIADTRAQGTHPAVYMHSLCFDDASPFFSKLKDSVLVDESGNPMKYPWSNVDTAGQNWYMSYASKEWRDFLLKQAEYIMEILNPDAIVMDETFLCIGYEEHPDRKGPLSNHSIGFMKELRELVHSYGRDKALLSSDCSMASMVLWADGEAGDHSYPSLLGNPLYRKEPIRFEAPLAGKPWLPCSWHFIQMWDAQMDLARKGKTGVGVANGYIEFNGLKNLPAEIAVRIKNDIQSLF